MSYIRFQQECKDCGGKWNAAFGIVGTFQIAVPPEVCPKCGSKNIGKFADDWDFPTQEQRGVTPKCKWCGEMIDASRFDAALFVHKISRRDVCQNDLHCAEPVEQGVSMGPEKRPKRVKLFWEDPASPLKFVEAGLELHMNAYVNCDDYYAMEERAEAAEAEVKKLSTRIDEYELAETKAVEELARIRDNGVHVGACNYWNSPIGSPGCICSPISKYDLSALREELARVREALKEAFIVMTGKEGSNAPFDAERWASAVDGVAAALLAPKPLDTNEGGE